MRPGPAVMTPVRTTIEHPPDLSTAGGAGDLRDPRRSFVPTPHHGATRSGARANRTPPQNDGVAAFQTRPTLTSANPLDTIELRLRSPIRPSKERTPMQNLVPCAEKVAALLKKRGETVAVAESSAGGLLSAALLAVPGASAYFLGGAVVYTYAARGVFLDLPSAALTGLRPATEPYALLLGARYGSASPPPGAWARPARRGRRVTATGIRQDMPAWRSPVRWSAFSRWRRAGLIGSPTCVRSRRRRWISSRRAWCVDARRRDRRVADRRCLEISRTRSHSTVSARQPGACRRWSDGSSASSGTSRR